MARKKAPKADWYSTPDSLRHRIEVHWTLPREVIDAVRALADHDRSPSIVAEDAIRKGLGLPQRKKD